MAYLQIKNTRITYQELRQHLPQDLPAEQTALIAFCHAWLRGDQEFVRHTSGSTGTPKPITLSRAQMEASARQTLHYLGIEKNDLALVAIPTQYIGGTMMLVRAMLADIPAIVVEPTGNPFSNLPPDLSPTFTALVPLQLENILAEPATRQRFESCQHVLIGGAALSPALEAACAALPNAVYNTYGMTETVSHVALRRISGKAEEDFSLMKGVEMRQDERGCLALRGTVTQNTWLQTNDVVELSGPNRFRWLGRADSIINSGGIKIQPELLEMQIQPLFPAFAADHRFCVSSLPDARLGEKLVLVFEGIAWAKAQSELLIQLLKKALPAHQAPKQISFLPRFPETGTGKTQRQALRTMLTNVENENL